MAQGVQNNVTTNPPGMVSTYRHADSASPSTWGPDAMGRRTDVVYTGSAFSQAHPFKSGYSTRSELTTADQYEGTAPNNPGARMTPGDFDVSVGPSPCSRRRGRAATAAPDGSRESGHAGLVGAFTCATGGGPGCYESDGAAAT